jgi:hypothetical protein
VTWWNIYGTNPNQAIALPSCDFGPLLFFAGNWNAPSAAASGGGGDRRRRMLQDGAAVASAQAPEAWAHAPGPADGTFAMGDSSSSTVRASALSLSPYCVAQLWRVEDVNAGKQLWPADLYSAMVTARQQGRVFFD